VYKPEIDELLTRNLGRIEAPEELWNRIENPHAPARVPARHARVRTVLALATAVLITAVAYRPRTIEVEYRLPQHNLTLKMSKASQPAEALNTACHLCHAGV
jgi:hypothetical protein